MLDRLQKGIGLPGMMVLRQFPDHHSAQPAIARVTDLGLAGPLVIVRDEHVGSCARIVYGEVSGLRVGIPSVKTRLVVAGHNAVVSDLCRRRRGRP